MSDIVIYEDGKVELSATVENETVWLSQKQMSELFDVQRPAVTKHLSNIFKNGELDEKVVCSILEHTTQHGAIKSKKQAKKTKLYNLDVILSSLEQKVANLLYYVIKGQPFNDGNKRIGAYQTC